jgi:hypothetical protein
MRRRSIIRRRDRGGAAAGGGATSVSSTFKQQINISKYIKLITFNQTFKQQINYLFMKSNQMILDDGQTINRICIQYQLHLNG